MALTDPNSEAMKRVLKEALAETLHEQRELLHEVLEDIALAEAIREGQQTDRVDRDEVFDVLEDRV